MEKAVCFSRYILSELRSATCALLDQASCSFLAAGAEPVSHMNEDRPPNLMLCYEPSCEPDLQFVPFIQLSIGNLRGFDPLLLHNSSPFHFCLVHVVPPLPFSLFLFLFCFFTSIIALLVWVMEASQAK